jgi:hypothetical protein
VRGPGCLSAVFHAAEQCAAGTLAVVAELAQPNDSVEMSIILATVAATIYKIWAGD